MLSGIAKCLPCAAAEVSRADVSLFWGYATVCYIMLHYIILHYTVLYDIIVCYILLYYSILYDIL